MSNFLHSALNTCLLVLSFFSLFVFPALIIFIGIIWGRKNKKKGKPLVKPVVTTAILELINAAFLVFGFTYKNTDDDPILTVIMLVFVAVPYIVVYILPVAYIVMGTVWSLVSHKKRKRIITPVAVTLILESVNVIPIVYIVKASSIMY